MKVALVHERLTELGGSERVVSALAAVWPDAPLYVPIADRAAPMPGLERTDIRTSWLQHAYRGGTTYSYLLPGLPLAMATTRIDADVVVTSHHAFANRIRVRRPGTPVVSYTHSPGRWMWDAQMRRGELGGAVGSAVLGAFAATQRGSDKRAAGRLHTVVANSTEVAERVRRWWGRDAVVVHPPVETRFHTHDPSVDREDFFLVAGRLVPYKRPEIAVAAAVRAGVKLVVAGDGRARAAVEAAAGPGITVLGSVDDDELRSLYRRCRALVFPGVEDFGIIPVEAMATGAPVIALGRGGARDTVVPGVSGVLVPPVDGGDEALIDAFADALARFEPSAFPADRVVAHAAGFSTAVFQARMAEVVAAAVRS